MEIVKGKRTKRSRQPSPLTLAMASTSSNVSEATPATSADFMISSTEEEEDTANCLILLAQSRIPAEDTCRMLYQCRTCDRCFSSFQALGGHRTSHKKPRTVGTLDGQEKKQFSVTIEENGTREDTALTLGISSDIKTSRKSKVHQCGICGSEFSSGQALGGHMRRHRPIPMTNRNVLPLDLNLPAPPEDDHRECSRFGLGSKEQVIAFSVASMVDCHF